MTNIAREIVRFVSDIFFFVCVCVSSHDSQSFWDSQGKRVSVDFHEVLVVCLHVHKQNFINTQVIK